MLIERSINCSVSLIQSCNEGCPKSRVLSPKTTSKRQWMVLAVLAYGNFCVAACVSLQAPFFPAECDKKGVTPEVYGLIFGVYELVILFASPIFGKLLTYITPNFFLQSGLFMAGGTTILFGILDHIPDTFDFTLFAFILRIFEGLGAAAFLTACYTLMPLEFPENIPFLFACLETCFGVGLIVGPTCGGALFELGEYPMPFIVLGGLMLLGSIFALIVLPKSGDKTDCKKSPSIFKFICDFGVLLDIITIAGVLNLIGFNAASLEQHLRQFALSPTEIGSIFIITGSIYAFTSPFWGKIGGKGERPRWMALFGSVTTTIGLLLLGPTTFLPLKAELWLVIVSLVIVGVGMAAKLVGAYIAASSDATERRGYPNETSTHAMVSAMYFSSCSAGAFVGPSLGGALLGSIGYRAATDVILFFEIFTVIALIIYQCCGPKIHKSQPLLI